MCDGHSHDSPNVSDTIKNLRQPMPLGRKARLFIRNPLVVLRQLRRAGLLTRCAAP